MGPLPGAGAEEIAAGWPAQVPAGQRMVPLMRSAQPARAPSSAATPRALASAGALQGANQEPHASSHSHRHPVCAQGLLQSGHCVSAVRVPVCPVCVYINTQRIQRAECISSLSPSQRRPVELCCALFVGPVRHFVWHLMGSEVCTEVSAVVAQRKGLCAPLVLGPCAMAVSVRAAPFLAFNLLQLFLPDLWTPLTYPSDIYPWRAGTVPLPFPLPSSWSFLRSPWTPAAGCEAAVGYPCPGPQEEENDALPSPEHCRATGQFGSPSLSRGFRGVFGDRDEFFQPNPVELGERLQMPALVINPVLEAKERARRGGSG